MRYVEKLDWYRFRARSLDPNHPPSLRRQQAAVADYKSREAERGQGLHRLLMKATKEPSQPTSSTQVAGVGEVEED